MFSPRKRKDQKETQKLSSRWDISETLYCELAVPKGSQGLPRTPSVWSFVFGRRGSEGAKSAQSGLSGPPMRQKFLTTTCR